MNTIENKLKNHIINWLPKDFVFDCEGDDSVYIRNVNTDETFAIKVVQIFDKKMV